MCVGSSEAVSVSGPSEFVMSDRRIGLVRYVASSYGGIGLIEEVPGIFAECVLFCGYGHWGQIAALRALQGKGGVHPGLSEGCDGSQ
jgi:hypothetical protein